MRNLLTDYGEVRDSIAFDIETVMAVHADEYIDKFKSFDAPGNYKDPEVIAKYIEKAKAKERDRAAIYIPTQQVWVICAEHVVTGERIHFEGKEERDVIRDFFEYLDSYPTHVLFGFNSRTFDVPALFGASVRHSLAVPPQLRTSQLQSDVLDDFYHVKVRLRDIAFLMGDSKLMDGSEVGQSWLSYVLEGNEKERDKVIDYCYQDTHLCAEYVRKVYGNN